MNQIKRGSICKTKPRYEGDPGETVKVTRLEEWRGGTWAHVRFAGDRVSRLMMHVDDLTLEGGAA